VKDIFLDLTQHATKFCQSTMSSHNLVRAFNALASSTSFLADDCLRYN
jgi:hypothetical protein